MEGNSEKIEAQQKLYSDLYVIFSKHSKKLATLANGLNEQVLAAGTAHPIKLTQKNPTYSTISCSPILFFASLMLLGESRSD